MSLTLHAAIVAALVLGVRFGPSRAPIASSEAIEAIMVDQAMVEREIERVREAEQAADRAREQQEREARERAEAERRERERQEAERIEHERQAQIELQQQREAAERRAREEAERIERERLAEQQRQAEEAARREQERVAELERQREAEERRRREAEEARQQAELEQELQAALAAEEELRRARDSGELDRYLLQIQSRIEANWIRPASATAGLECVVNVTQIPTGDVVSVSVGRCNGDAAVRRSIESAVLRASPLPTPSIPALFDRNLEVIFKPNF
jgi:colicin import membrane protein